MVQLLADLKVPAEDDDEAVAVRVHGAVDFWQLVVCVPSPDRCDDENEHLLDEMRTHSREWMMVHLVQHFAT